MERYRGTLASFGRAGMSCLGASDVAIGMTGWLLGQDDQARRDFATGNARNRELGLRPHLAQGLYWQARHLLQLGTPVEDVRPLLDEAAALARALGLGILEGRVAALLASPASAALPGAAAGRRSRRLRATPDPRAWRRNSSCSARERSGRSPAAASCAA